MKDFVDTLPPDTALVHTPALEPAILKDVARTFELLGVQGFRASVVEVESMKLNAQWAISEFGSVSRGDADVALDSAFPNVSTAISQLADSDSDKTLTQQLSPRRWRFVWRLDPDHAMVAEAQFHERRDAVIEMDIALLRLVCGMGVPTSAGLNPGDAPPQVATPAAPPSLEPRKERRSSRRTLLEAEKHAAPVAEVLPPAAAASKRGRKGQWLPLALLVATVLLTGSIALLSAPQAREALVLQQQEVARQRAIGQDTMVLELSIAMVSGDYGQVQAVLSSFATLGYFQGALVSNTRQRIVAMAGRTERLRIGDVVPSDVAETAQRFDLKLGSQEHGQLLIVPAPPQSTPQPLSTLLGWSAWAAFATSLVSAILLAARMRRERGPRPETAT